MGKCYVRDVSCLPKGKWSNLVSSLFCLFLLAVKHGNCPTSPYLPKPALTEEEVERKSKAIIGEYLLINDLKVQTVHRAP